MTKGLRMFYVGPDEHAIRSGEAVEIMASSHEEAMEKGLVLHARGLLIKGDYVAIELFITDGDTHRTFEFEPSPIDCPDWIERDEEPTNHPSLWPLLNQLQHEAHWQAVHTATATTDQAQWLPEITPSL